MTSSSRSQPKFLLAAAFLSLVGFTAVATHAADSAPEKQAPQLSADSTDQHSMDMMNGPDNMKKPVGMGKDLKLSEKQRDTLKSGVSQMRDSMKSEKDMRDQLHSLIESDTYSDKKVHELIQKRNAEQENNLVKGAKTMHEFFASLSPEQKEKYKEIQSEMDARMKSHMKGQ